MYLDKDGKDREMNNRRETRSGVKDSIPAWIKFSIQAPGEIPYSGIYYDPPEEDAATGSVSRNLDNSLLFVPLKPFVAEFPAAKKEEQSDRLSNLVGAGYQAFEDAILNKLTKLQKNNKNDDKKVLGADCKCVSGILSIDVLPTCPKFTSSGLNFSFLKYTF
ncbi:hypothetical protein V6Z11_D10G220500 [Gossypium hirsutum]|uniref:Uncharacterized protein isoform X3 n=1 Tax=Gossypium hirsutum TaxID=3635 RepID=A0A1U8KBB8_GOSHI|nr:uncharacterized protein LOC107915158 isoform X3 [Gossypium hirsutum]XP_016699802.2 uncharacterized protein LOC107915158 isoform X3 [Gossypium hirsutum]XP_016699803.2 uncharacterized protein LOC107915158 isoform X3 [Gossypium hirsutum]